MTEEEAHAGTLLNRRLERRQRLGDAALVQGSGERKKTAMTTQQGRRRRLFFLMSAGPLTPSFLPLSPIKPNLQKRELKPPPLRGHRCVKKIFKKQEGRRDETILWR